MITSCFFSTAKNPHFIVNSVGNSIKKIDSKYKRLINNISTCDNALNSTKLPANSIENKKLKIYAISKDNHQISLNFSYTYQLPKKGLLEIKAEEIVKKTIVESIKNYHYNDCLLIKLEHSSKYLNGNKDIILFTIISKYFENLNNEQIILMHENTQRLIKNFKDKIIIKSNIQSSEQGVQFFDFKILGLQFIEQKTNDLQWKKLNRIYAEIQQEVNPIQFPTFHNVNGRDFRKINNE